MNGIVFSYMFHKNHVRKAIFFKFLCLGPVFGVPLEVAVERSGFPDKIELPRIVRECILFIEEKGVCLIIF